MFNLITPVSYWILTILWLVILWLYIAKLRESKTVGGVVAVLLSILAIDAFRTLFESIYFGLYFNSLFGLLPKTIHETLSQPALIIIPKLINVVAGLTVLFLLIRRWIPREIHEREEWINKIQKSEEQFAFAMQGANDGLWDWDLKTDEVYYSPRWKSMLGYTEDELKPNASEWKRLLHPVDTDRASSEAVAFINGETKKYEIEFRLQHKDGHYVDILSRAFPVKDEEGRVIRLVGTHVDITERKQAEEELQILSRAVESSSSAVIITSPDGNIEYVNFRFTEITGYTKAEVLGKIPRVLLQSDEIPDSIYDEISQSLTSKDGWKGEFRSRKKDGSLYWDRASISCVKDAAGQITHYIGIQDDVTREYELNEQLSYQASHDALTGLINRHEFERRVERLLATIRQDKDEHAMCYLDLDQFKVVNDTCGHIAGDELLRQLGQILQNTVRHRDTLARLGGDEFGILMEHCSLDHAHRVATSLQKAVQDFQFSWEGHSFKLGVSIGLVAITEAIPNLTELLKRADAACYMAKDLGRNRIHVYQTEDTNLAQRHGEMQWVARIYKALEEDRFCLYAQSIVPLDGSANKHYELLIRMIDEQGKVIPPGAFLPAAERYNLITQLDHCVIEKTFNILADNPEFQSQIDFISINLSGQSLTENNVLDFIILKLDKTGIDAKKICFEITETMAIANLSNATKFISTLKGLGCRFALDDFGSGLSSFGYLKNLPVDYLKIDGMFVKDIVDDPIDHAMVKSINEIGHVMGMQTIAEFVENDEIKGMLKEIGVDFAQGYGIHKPQPFEELLERFKE